MFQRLMIKLSKKVWLFAFIAGVLIVELGSLGLQYFKLLNLNKTPLFSIEASYRNRRSKQGQLEQLNWFFSVNGFPTNQLQLFDCDNNKDGKVDDPITLFFPNEWLRPRFINEFSRCGTVGDLLHVNYIWLYSQDQVSTYLTSLFGLKPYNIFVLESIQVRPWNVILAVDERLLSRNGSCAEAITKPCINVGDIKPSLEIFKLSTDQVFILPFAGDLSAGSVAVDCEALLADEAHQTRCHTYRENTYDAAIAHAKSLFQSLALEQANGEQSPLFVFISVTDIANEYNLPNMDSLLTNNDILTWRVLVGKNLPAKGIGRDAEYTWNYQVSDEMAMRVFLKIWSSLRPKDLFFDM